MEWIIIQSWCNGWLRVMLLHYVHKKVRWGTDPAPRGAFRGRAPQMTACAPPNENCAPPSWKKALLLLFLSLVAIQFAPPPPLATPVLGVDVVRQTQSAWFIRMIDRVTTAKVHDLWKMLVRKNSTISFTLFKRLRMDTILLWIGYQRLVESAPIFRTTHLL